MSDFLAFVLPLLLVAVIVSPGVADYRRVRRNERQRLDAWVRDVRELQDEQLEDWQRRREQTRELSSKRVA